MYLNSPKYRHSRAGGNPGPASVWARGALFLALALTGCVPAEGQQEPDVRAAVKTGAQVLAEGGFERFRSQRVGLVANHTAVVDSAHLIDAIHAADVEIGALFGPEHGLRGEDEAGDAVEDGRDVRTGTPIYSLYGATRKPTPEMLSGLDVLVFDIQDIGARFYTYISTMGLAMQAAAEAGIPFVLLDRPNPLGGQYVSGFVLEPEHHSFVGAYPIPVAHGMTVGELARMIQGEGMMEGLEDLELEVVEMEDWTRATRWPETGLPWIAPSPNIPDVETAFVYAGACFFEATSASEGRGTRQPFKLLGAPWADADVLADTLNSRSLPGVYFEPATFTPESIASMASNPKLEGEDVRGVRYVVEDLSAFRPVETGIYVLHAFHQAALQAGVPDFISRPDWLITLGGTTELLHMLEADASPQEIIAAWQADVQAFEARRSAYLLYP